MSDARMVSEMELRLRERKAFHDGTRWQHAYEMNQREFDSKTLSCWTLFAVENAAANKYPLPKVTRPRVLKDEHGVEWRVSESGTMYCRDRTTLDGAWDDWALSNTARYVPTPERAKLWADLFTTPTEEVDDE